MHILTKGDQRKAVAPIIATLLMVAISVVGGILIFVFAQGFFNQTQVSSTPQIESLSIFGYDARVVSQQNNHAGTSIGVANAAAIAADVTAGSKLTANDRVAIYIRNGGSQAVTISTLQLAGITYTYQAGGTIDAVTGNTHPTNAKFELLLKGATATDAGSVAVLQSGQLATIIVGLDDTYKVGREGSIKITTVQGNVFLGTIVFGQAV